MIVTFTEILSEPAMAIVLLVIFLTGIIRGFSGFGSGMIIGPTTAAFYSPITALVMIVILDLVPTLLIVWPARKDVNWTEVGPIVLGYALLAPIGVWVLKTGDPTTLRWFISISILIAVAILWSGWKYTGRRSPPISTAVGGVGGFMGTAAALPGPAVLVYWLASAAKAATVRANMIYYLFITDFIVAFSYYFADLYTYDAVMRGILVVPGYFFGIAIGMLWFKGASDTTYKNIAFAMIVVSAVSSLPMLDQWLRV